MNSKNYGAYVKSVNQQSVLIDGSTFVRLLLMHEYDRKMFDNFFRNGERYYVPDFSYTNALVSALSEEQASIVSEVIKKIPKEYYEIFKTDTEEISHFGEDADFATVALIFIKNHPTATMRVSSTRIWDLMRKAQIQEMREELDLL